MLAKFHPIFLEIYHSLNLYDETLVIVDLENGWYIYMPGIYSTTGTKRHTQPSVEQLVRQVLNLARIFT